MIYIVHNHLTNNQEILSEQQLDNCYSELKSGQLEIVDEIDNRTSEQMTLHLWNEKFKIECNRHTIEATPRKIYRTLLIEQIESKALNRAQRIFRRLGGHIEQISDLIITDNIALYTQCYIHSYNKLIKKELQCH